MEASHRQLSTTAGTSSQIAPVGYDAHHFLFAPKIEQWAKKHGISEHTITLVITAPGVQREVFKPYKGMYKTKQNNYQVEIMDVIFYPENPGPDAPFWAWYGKSDLLGMISDERSAGLRFRQSNIGLGGPDKVAELFTGGEGMACPQSLYHMLSGTSCRLR